ncbi:membrane protein AbrB duplication [Schinkia azotoformans MEV2011]|uniref:Membrane protein AbrB duplication n=1 Tax=Schinkia azotoformans MEV2011 TaxID=1348973 RepID=A0A072NK72_SCHAZ|nr:AbrB family transcriptional regulator [Schinkia azotoformans]KEF37876.1 membrane protein AbrB duplication [Schinkia azotoformans MEV2011]MEC1696558.1 AbrB family transcriptional regulator [Schinkia azotoformans]MEC1725951.1 AbrB family transcriptional regulator [Schinkia azotoformans]MEC1745756.1 AbrB family transcriptional regulator [Schinkia azotoformans]MEC1770102.1 AbrB family transcriptional regulator [Schinkia azotoformans]
MKGSKGFLRIFLFVVLSGTGGFLLSLTGLSIGWMIGTLIMATVLSFTRPKFLSIPNNKAGIPKYWLYIGQCILGIELGQKMNTTVLFTFRDNWLAVTIMLLLSISFSLLAGYIFWKISNLDMLTSFFATAPGGMSAMPGIADEVGANTGIVSIIQTVRVFLVILTIPVLLSSWFSDGVNTELINVVANETIAFEPNQILMTIILVFVAIVGYHLGKLLRFPAPWLLGSMVSIAIFKSLSSLYLGHDLSAWWSHELIIFSQIFIGASIGSRFHKKMFVGLKKTLFVSSLCTIGFILSMFLCAYIVSAITGITFITSALAFAPGGVAEMTTTAVVLKGDPTFVVAVQVFRIIAVCVMLPPVFRLLNYWDVKKNKHSQISA